MRGISRVWCLLSILLVAGCSTPQPQVATRDFSHLLARGVSRGLPGMWLAVGTVEALDWAGAAGFSSLAGAVDAEVDDGVHMASITKSFTAVATLQLVDSGHLSLDDRLVDLLPDETVGRIPNVEEITVRQLLDHSSGIYGFNNNSEYLSFLVGPDAGQDRVWTPQEFVALAFDGTNEPFGLPGEGHYYGDTNYVLLGLIVESLSGAPLKTIVADRVLGPLRMGSTYYLTDYLNGSGAPPTDPASGYLSLSRQLLSVMPVNDEFPRVREDLAETSAAGETIDAAAGLITTVPDLHRFGRALFGGELLQGATHTWLLSVADGMDVAELETERVRALRAYRKPYGVIVTAEGDGPGGSNSLLAYHPETGVVVAAMTNVHGLWFESDFFLDEVVAEAVKAYAAGPHRH